MPGWYNTTTPSWWEVTAMIIALVIFICSFLLVGYVLYKGELVISGAMMMFALGGYIIASDPGNTLRLAIGTAVCLLALEFSIIGASMWGRNEEEDNDLEDIDDPDNSWDTEEDYGLIPTKKRQPKLSKKRHDKLRGPLQRKREIRRETRDMDL